MVFAVIPPAAARWIRNRSGLTEVSVRNEVAYLRGMGRTGLAGQLELAWSQLQAADGGAPARRPGGAG